MTSGRRRFLQSGAAAIVAGIGTPVFAAATPTPRMTEGPFYPERFSAQPTVNLLNGPVPEGLPMVLAGIVSGVTGNALGDARVEIWQCDPKGKYHHVRDSLPAERDPAFLGHGWMRTGADGRYAFQTIRPVPYPGRTPHIHFAVRAPGRAVLITQLFVIGEAGNERDGVWRSLGATQRDGVSARVENDPGGRRMTFNLVLA